VSQKNDKVQKQIDSLLGGLSPATDNNKRGRRQIPGSPNLIGRINCGPETINNRSSPDIGNIDYKIINELSPMVRYTFTHI